jgi:HAD superfamily hydrolase (TIGR01509 family)
VILWDLMDTLVRDPFFTHMSDFFGLSFAELLREKHPTAWRDFELDEIDEEQLYRSFFKDGRAIDGPGLKHCMHGAYRWIDGMEAVLEELGDRGTSMHLLSNYPRWFELCDDRVGFSRLVSPSFVSCRTGRRKPDPSAFTRACESLGVAPERCLFVDDRVVNCDAARSVGMRALHFEQDVPALRRELARLGLLARVP